MMFMYVSLLVTGAAGCRGCLHFASVGHLVSAGWCVAGVGLGAMALKPKNTATAGQIAAVFRGSLKALNLEDFLLLDMDSLVDRFKTLMLLVLKLTPKPIASVLAAAAQDCFELKPEEAKLFGDRLAGAFSYCRKKGKSTASGKKLPPSASAVISAMSCGSAGHGQLCRRRAGGRGDSSSPPKDSFGSCSSSSSSSLARASTRADILNSYGFPAAAAHKIPVCSSEVLNMFSSQEAQEPKPKQKASDATSSSSQSIVQYLDSALGVLVRVQAGQVVAKAEMAPGPNGFAIGKFPGEAIEHESELPNLYIRTATLEPGCKKRPASSQLQKQKHRQQQHKEGPPPAVAAAPVLVEDQPPQCSKMYYKNTGAWAIRQRFFNKQQILQIKSDDLGKEELESIIDEALLKLAGGMGEAEVKAWAKSQV